MAEMNCSDKIKRDLKILKLETLDGMSLGQLFDAIAKNLPVGVSKQRVLRFYVMWLHHRLMAIDVSADGSFAHEIAGWYRSLNVLSIDDRLVAEVFGDWQREQAMENPTSSRRLSIAETELRKLMNYSSTSQKPIPKLAESKHGYGQMHPDRVRLSQATSIVADLDNDGQMHPDRVKLARVPPVVIEIIDDDDDDDIVMLSSRSLRNDRRLPQKQGRASQPDLPFLTGSNTLALNKTARIPSEEKGINDPRPQTRSMPVSSGSRSIKQKGKETGNPKKAQKNLMCDRCGRKGHLLKLCPTNMDPAFDRKPPKNYRCDFCMKVGDHFGALCPKHPDPTSVGRQRQRHGKTRSRTDTENSVEPGAGFRSDPTLRLYDDRESRFDDSTRSRGRSRSPAREARDLGDSWDGYSPADEFSRLGLSSSQPKRRSKRKASHSPAPAKNARRQKNHPWAPARVATKPSRNIMSDRAEGRLSYDDEVDGYVPPAPLAARTVRSSGAEKMDIDMSKTPLLKTGEEAAHTAVNQSLELDVLEMIRVESAKTDLLLLINGVERIPPAVPFLVQLFRDGGGVWVNETLNNVRLCSTDFLEALVEEEQFESMNCEAATEADAGTVEEQALTCVKMDGVDSTMMPSEPACPATTTDVDEEMTTADVAVLSSSQPVDGSTMDVDDPVITSG